MSRLETKFDITDTGDYVESTYRCAESSSLYGKIIGRRKVVLPSQKAFTTTDIVLEGYLQKEGSWRKSWKTRYFILRKDIRTLCVFTSKDEYLLIGAIPLDQKCVVYSDLRNGSEAEHIFGIKLSDADENPEILMAAPDESTKRIWLNALISECQRTDEVVATDWWTDMYGSVPVLDSKTMSELVKQHRAAQQEEGGVRSCSQEHQTGDIPAGDDAACVEDAVGAANMALLSFAENEDDFHNSVDTVRLAMPDQDSDDEVEEISAHQPPKLRGAQRSVGSTAFLDSPHESRDSPRTGSGDNSSFVKDPRQSSQTTQLTRDGEPHTSSITNGAAKMGTPKPKDRKKDHTKAALESVYRESKGEKQKPIASAPLQFPSADRHETKYGFSGLKISIRIENMCQHMDRFFLVIFTGHNNKDADATEPGGAKSFLSWKPLSRTEEICVEDKPEYGESVIRAATRQFSLLQGPMENESASHLMFILFRNEEQKASGSTGFNFSNHVLVSKTTIKKDVLNTGSGLFKFDMTIMADRYLDLSSSPWTIQKSKIILGVAIVSSPKISVGRQMLQKRMNGLPYAETAYCLRSRHGQVLALEELFISKLAIMAPQSFLGLVFVERMRQMSDLVLVARDDLASLTRNSNELNNIVLKDYFSDTTTSPPTVPERLFVQPSCFNSFSKVAAESLGVTELNVRVAAMKKLCAVLDRISNIVFEYYENSYRHYLKISSGGNLKNAVIGSEYSGSYLRRSVWKKTPTWQFAPVNLNVQFLMTQTVRASELKANSETLRQSASAAAAGFSSDVDYFPSITHGAFAAHSLGFHEGGLRRIFSKITPEDVKIEWLQVLQQSGGLRFSALEPMIKEFPSHAEILFSLSSHPDDPAEFYSRASNLALRIDICISEAIAHAVTCLKTLVTMASLGLSSYEDKLKCSLRAGYLIPIESLLSSQGNEMGMIEDLDGILSLLNSVSFRFVKKPTENSVASNSTPGAYGPPDESGVRVGSTDTDVPPAVRLENSDIEVLRDVKGRLVVDIRVCAEEEAVIRKCVRASAGYEEWASSSAFYFDRSCKAKESPRCNYKIGQSIPDIISTIQVCAIVFTQGVNEMQTLANMSGDSYKQSLINVDSIGRLQGYINGYIEILRYFHTCEASLLPVANDESSSKRQTPAGSDSAVAGSADGEDASTPSSEAIAEITRLYRELDKSIQATVASPNEKNVNVLLNASRIGRFLSGCMSILCKSGKDRTSMSVTLEQTRHLAESSEVYDGKDLCRVMRRHGVRRMNVWANTGQTLYAFNSFQRQILPTCYAPPEGTFSGSVMS